jgi:hypothetical protein
MRGPFSLVDILLLQRQWIVQLNPSRQICHKLLFVMLGLGIIYYCAITLFRYPPSSDRFPEPSFLTQEIKAREVLCEPYIAPGYLDVSLDASGSQPLGVSFYSFSPTCAPPAKPWYQQIIDSVKDKTPIPELQNKELLLVGDSVDRNTIQDLCALSNAETRHHPLESYQLEVPKPSKGEDPCHISCHIAHLNLTLANWFFYGFDETGLWRIDRANLVGMELAPPKEFSKRYYLNTI